MMLVEKAWMMVRNNFASLFIFQFLFLFSNFFLLAFLKGKVEGFMGLLEVLSPSISSLGAAEGAAQNAGLEALVGQLGPAVHNTLLLMFMLTPLAVLGLWVLFQG